jgi:hypothetical protein
MSFFVDSQPVAIYLDEDPESIIFIRPKMGYGAKKRVESALVHLEQGTGGRGNVETTFDLGAYNLTLLRENIVRWEGPLFVDGQGRKLPYKPELLERIDPDHPLLDKVLGEIQRRNMSREEAEAAQTDDEGVIEGEAVPVEGGEGEEKARPNPSSSVSRNGTPPSKALTRVK